MARRKRETTLTEPIVKKDTAFENNTVLILSGTEIWSRIIDTQFKSVGYPSSIIFKDFSALIRHIMEQLHVENPPVFSVAVGFKEIKSFLTSWELLRKEMIEKQMKSILDHIPFFMILESSRQVPEVFVKTIGEDRVIYLTDDTPLNREKVLRVKEMISD